MPWSNKRTAGLPSPKPIGLQRCCSLGCTRPWLHAGSSITTTRIPTPQAMPSSNPMPDPCSARTPAFWAAPDPQPSRIPTPRLLPLRHCWTPDLHGLTRSMLPWDPCPSVPAGSQLGMGQPEPHSTEIPAPWAEPGPSSTGFPDKCTTRLPLRLSLGDSQCT
jgi:hypothetical protein